MLYGAAIALTAFDPAIGVERPAGFVAGIAVLVIATATSVVLSTDRSLWRFGYLVAMLDVVALALLRLGTDSGYSPLIYLVILPAMFFAGEVLHRNVIFAGLGTFVVLVLPILADGVAHSLIDLGAALFATIVVSFAALIFHSVVSAQRDSLAAMEDVSELRDDLLAESVRQIELLEVSQAERRAVEQTFRGLWSAVTEQAAIGTDLNGFVDAWNPGAEKMFGIPAASVEVSRNIVSFHVFEELRQRERELELSPDTEGPAAGLSALVASAEHGVAEVRDWTYVRDDGTSFPVQVSVSPRLSPSSNIVGYLFVANDMTNLREVARLKDEFIGLISHELRTPLSSILGYLELLREEEPGSDLSATQRSYLDVAERNAQRLLRLVSDLLFTAQVESGSFDLDMVEVELAPILHASIESARPTAARSGVTICADVAEGLVVKGDPLRLGQAVDNLVSNAIKFSPRGGVVTVSLAESASGAVVTVSDTGMGIAAAEMTMLFSRFFRATSATRNAIPGVGLGLTITRAIVLAHHGVMSVESDEGVGTRFELTLQTVGVAARR